MLRPSALRLEKKDDKSTGPDPCPPRVGRDQKNEGQGGRGKGGIGPKESSGGTASDGRVVIGDFGGKRVSPSMSWNARDVCLFSTAHRERPDPTHSRPDPLATVGPSGGDDDEEEDRG